MRREKDAEALELVLEFADRVSGNLDGMITLDDQSRVRRGRWIQAQTAKLLASKD